MFITKEQIKDNGYNSYIYLLSSIWKVQCILGFP